VAGEVGGGNLCVGGKELIEERRTLLTNISLQNSMEDISM